MNALTKQRALELFDELCDLETAERSRQIDRRCGDDAELRAAVQRLLAEDDAEHTRDPLSLGGGEGFLVRELAGSVSRSHPDRIGRYRVIREVGRGGMGVVYEAKQEDPSRRVALKVIQSGYAGDELLKRFRREAQVLGQLQHPGIASVFEAGTADVDGTQVPFFAMEYIEGHPLDTHIAEQALSRREILHLFERICEAVQHAHDRGVVHRDLKPSNILVLRSGTTTSADLTSPRDRIGGTPKVLDFGVARILDEGENGVTLQTAPGQIIGTLSYMSPEQLMGAPDRIDARADVYAIGVMLYRSLSGRMPVDVGGLPVPVATAKLRETEPSRMSAFEPSLRGDIETIVATALDHDPNRRYRSAGELGDEIRRFLADEPIAARPASTLYQARKFAQRNRALVAGLLASFVLLVAGVLGTSVGLASALQANDRLEQTNTSLEDANDNLERTISFQQRQLRSVDLQAVGLAQRQRLLESVAPEQQEAFAELLKNVNFTDQARLTLDESFFAPTSDAIDLEFENEPATQGRLHGAIGDARKSLGLFMEAERSFDRSIELLLSAGLEDGAPLLDAVEARASLLHDQGLDTDSEQEYREQLASLEASSDSDPERRLRLSLGLARSLFRQGRMDEAEEYARTANDGFEAMFEAAVRGAPGDERALEASRLDSLITLARIRRGAGALQESIQLLEEAYADLQENLGAEHNLTREVMSALVYALVDVGRFAEAESIAREAIRIGEDVNGENHPTTLNLLGALCRVLSYSGRLAEAEEIRWEQLERTRLTLGSSHQSVAVIMGNLARDISSQGRFEEAEALYVEALAITDRTLGPDHPNNLGLLVNLATLKSETGRRIEAVDYYRRALEGFRREIGPEHPNTILLMSNLGLTLQRLERYDESRQVLGDAVEAARRGLGRDHPETLYAEYNMAALLIDRRMLDEGEPYCLASFEGRRSLLGNDHRDSLSSLRQIAELRLLQERFEEAEQLSIESAERHARVFGESHQYVGDSRDLAAQAAAGMKSRTNPGDGERP